MESVEFNPDARSVLYQLVSRYPDTPFLALGQTVFWDEPTKAYFARLLGECCPDAVFWHGVHNTDYFSRLPHPLPGRRPYTIVEHNDTTTEGLWVAMCEAARLFGAETVVTRADFRHHGCNLRKALAVADGSLSEDAVTAAWGWHGIASTGERDLVARDVMLSDLADELLALIADALDGTIGALLDVAVREAARRAADDILARVRDYARSHPSATLTQLYQHLLPHFYEMLLGRAPSNLRLTSSTQIFRFCPATADRPLFGPLALFLDARLGPAACRAYNDAVAGSGIYTLDQFGIGAIPFDLVVPGAGRGTISLRPGEIVIHTPEPIHIATSGGVETPQALADVLVANLGEDVALIGKAVMLIPMIAQEYVLVFHEAASAYTEHTHEFILSMERVGVSLNCRPILRLHHRTWESLLATDVQLALPDHLAEAFGTREIGSREFAARWQQARAGEQRLLDELSQTRKPAALIELLARYARLGQVHSCDAGGWKKRLATYLASREVLRAAGAEVAALQREGETLRRNAYRLRQQIQDLEREKGRHFHEVLHPLLLSGAPADAEKQRRRMIEERITEARVELARVSERIVETRSRQKARASSHDMVAARQVVAEQEGLAEVERVRLTRNAILTTRGLDLTNRRPTGWWFPLVSPDGAWFHRLAETCVLESESLCHVATEQGAAS